MCLWSFSFLVELHLLVYGLPHADLYAQCGVVGFISTMLLFTLYPNSSIFSVNVHCRDMSHVTYVTFSKWFSLILHALRAQQVASLASSITRAKFYSSISTMARTGWFNLEEGNVSNIIPDTGFFEGESAFSCLNLSKTTRLYCFIAWYDPISIECTLFTKWRHIVWFLVSY